MNADLDVDAGWDDYDGEEWRGTEEERKRKVDAYMDEVVNKLGFSGIVSLFSLQMRIVFTCKPCRRPPWLRIFVTLLCAVDRGWRAQLGVFILVPVQV